MDFWHFHPPHFCVFSLFSFAGRNFQEKEFKLEMFYWLSANLMLCRSLATSLTPRAQSDKLLSLLVDNKGEPGVKKRLEIKELVQKLVESGTKQKFQEQLLGGGSWTVKWTSGTLLWQIWTGPGQVFRTSKNKASQSFDPETRTALNEGEIFGSSVKVTAFGRYYPKVTEMVQIRNSRLQYATWSEQMLFFGHFFC